MAGTILLSPESCLPANCIDEEGRDLVEVSQPGPDCYLRSTIDLLASRDSESARREKTIYRIF
ncbi:MAG: hypothetical protein K6U00_14865, partial [Armatimonadetes bacterium]|nr:hypothetical protein [Armatimonadota bacterium]